jgi:hypothetical protein
MLEAGLGVGETRFMWVLGGCLTPLQRHCLEIN